MLIINSSRALSKLPFEQAIPFNADDLLIMINTDTAFRLRTICNEVGATFSITTLAKNTEKVFGKVSLDDRIKDLSIHFISKVDRFFITKKAEYIFFDSEEQMEIKKSLTNAGFGCSIELFKLSETMEFKIFDYLKLDPVKDVKIIRFLDNCSVKDVLTCSEGLRLSRKNGRRRSYNNSCYGFSGNINSTKELFKKYSRYKKLKDIKTKKAFNKYFKALRVKYHPDRCSEDIAEEYSKIIGEDFEELQKTPWFINLPDETNEKNSNDKQKTSAGGEENCQ